MYFNYHAKVKKLIKDGRLVSFGFYENWNGISPALVLFFYDEKPMPIREYRWQEYLELFDEIPEKECVLLPK